MSCVPARVARAAYNNPQLSSATPPSDCLSPGAHDISPPVVNATLPPTVHQGLENGLSFSALSISARNAGTFHQGPGIRLVS